ncbi:MAG TPA: hypothetical protein VMT94_02405 [Burkholderiales bacterium]|nr:hypothetical protein [Burkholderiales bacterium]
MQFDVTRPPKLYRYSEAGPLKLALSLGEFYLKPAAGYKQFKDDGARQDDELIRVQSSNSNHIKITVAKSGEEIKPISAVTYRSEIRTDYYVLCFSKAWDERLFSEFLGSDSCLIVHNVEEFCERIHAEVEVKLPHWAGMDTIITYGGRSPFGAIFSKPLSFLPQQEWRFAWLPPSSLRNIEPFKIVIGSIEKIAEIVLKPSHTPPIP